MKNNNHNPIDNHERQHYKKKYLERRLQEEDADKQIKEFHYDEENSSERTERPSYLP